MSVHILRDYLHPSWAKYKEMHKVVLLVRYHIESNIDMEQKGPDWKGTTPSIAFQTSLVRANRSCE